MLHVMCLVGFSAVLSGQASTLEEPAGLNTLFNMYGETKD